MGEIHMAEFVTLKIEIENENKERVISEAADLWFHSLVALSMKNLSSDDILNELDKRFGISGHEEKNNRNA